MDRFNSIRQLAALRELKDSKGMKLTRNFRDPHPLNNRSVFHINPSSDTSQLLLPGVIQAKSHGTSPVLVNYNYSNKVNWHKYFTKKKKEKFKYTDSKHCIDNVSHKEKFILMGATDVEKAIEKYILKILRCRDKLFPELKIEEECDNQKIEQLNKINRNKKNKSLSGVQNTNKHDMKLKLEEALLFFNSNDKIRNEYNTEQKKEMYVNETKFKNNSSKLDDSLVSNDDENKEVEVNLKIKDNNINSPSLSLKSTDTNEVVQNDLLQLPSHCLDSDFTSRPKNYICKPVYKTRSTRIKIAEERKRLEKMRRVKRLEEKKLKVTSIDRKINKKENLNENNNYNVSKLRKHREDHKNLYRHNNTVENTNKCKTETCIEHNYDSNTNTIKVNKEEPNLRCHEIPIECNEGEYFFKYANFQGTHTDSENTPFNTTLRSCNQSQRQNILERENKLISLKETERNMYKKEELGRIARNPSLLLENVRAPRFKSTPPRISTTTDESLSDRDKSILTLKYKQKVVKNSNLSVREKQSSLKHKSKSPIIPDRRTENGFVVNLDCDESSNDEEMKHRSVSHKRHKTENKTEKKREFSDKKGYEILRNKSSTVNTRNGRMCPATCTDKTFEENINRGITFNQNYDSKRSVLIRNETQIIENNTVISVKMYTSLNILEKLFKFSTVNLVR